MRHSSLNGVLLIWINLYCLTSGTTTVRRRGRPTTSTTTEATTNVSTSTTSRGTTGVSTSTTTGASTSATTQAPKVTHAVTTHASVTSHADHSSDNTTEFDYDGGTEWSVTKYRTHPPRKFGPVIRPEMTPKDIEHKLKESKIIPDILLKAPKNLVEVTYDKKRSVYMGNLYSCLQVDNPPVFVEWPCEKDSFYTLILTDPDSPTPDDPYQREFHHWIVGNIPGCHVRGGVTLSEYITPLPITYAGTHRYVFLVYKQDHGRIKFNWEHRDHRPTDALRADFNSEAFARNHSLSGPIAINYFNANWEMTMTPLPGDEEWLTTKDFYESFNYDEPLNL